MALAEATLGFYVPASSSSKKRKHASPPPPQPHEGHVLEFQWQEIIMEKNYHVVLKYSISDLLKGHLIRDVSSDLQT